MSGRTCSFDGCGGRHFGLGWCQTHYRRYQRHGDVTRVAPSGTARQVIVGYTGAHWRLDRDRGPATMHPCAHCECRADEWAYDHADPDERTLTRNGRLVSYSVDPAHYIPLCHSCHSKFDKARVSCARM